MRNDLTTDRARSTETELAALHELLAAAREALRNGHLVEAKQALARLDAEASSAGDTRLIIEGAAVSAVVEATSGDIALGWEVANRAQALAREFCDEGCDAIVHLTRATLFELGGELEAFEREARAARRDAEGANDPLLLARSDEYLAIAASIQGDTSAALLRFGSAMANFKVAGDEFFAAVAQCNIGALYLETGEFGAALELFDAAIPTLTSVGGPLYIALSGRTRCLAHLKRADEAMIESARALASATGFGRRGLSFAYEARATALLAKGRQHEAVACYKVTEELSDKVAPYHAASACLELAAIYMDDDRIGDCFAALDRAGQRYLKLGAVGGQRRVLIKLTEMRDRVADRLLKRVRGLEMECAMPRRHSEGVAGHAVELADFLQVSPLDCRWLELGALLHDVGCQQIPADALSNLSAEDVRDVQSLHCSIGDATLEHEGFPRVVRNIVRHHHERWDGSGYPDRLAGVAIPQLARIVAVAERYNALRSSRHNRTGFSRVEAMARLREEAGSSLDPTLVDAFTTMMGQRPDTAHTSHAPTGASDGMQPAWTDDTAARVQAALGASYVLGREIKGGGMSRLFRAREVMLERDVVVKVLPPEQDEVAALRFRREMTIAAHLAHPRILQILHAGTVDTRPYFIMPFVSGGSVREKLLAGAIETAVAITLLKDVAEALAYAHSKGVIHRDIKPGNVLLQDGRALLADFGVARRSEWDARSGAPPSLTETGKAVGTVGYMAPEQLLGDGLAATQMDVYSFGVLAYEMLSGAPPFAAPTAIALMYAHVTREAAALHSVVPLVPRALAAVVDAALRKAASERPRDGAALVAALAAV